MRFIKTQSEEVAKFLRDHGYMELERTGNCFNFINNGKATFSEDQKKQIVMSNIMAI